MATPAKPDAPPAVKTKKASSVAPKAARKVDKAAKAASAAPETGAPVNSGAKSGAKSGKRVKVTYARSANNRPKVQLQTLMGLGLRKLNHSRELEDTPSVRGMIKRVAHLLRVEEI
jgi:large subunit ribosomal protein L30